MFSQSFKFCLTLLGIAVATGAADAASNSLLWQDRLRPGYDPAARIAVDRTRVFVVGRAPVGKATGIGWLVRAYEQTNGNVDWQDSYVGPRGDSDKAQAVDIGDDLLFVGGYVDRAGAGRQAMLRAYDVVDGAPRWSRLITLHGGDFASFNWLKYIRDTEHSGIVVAVGRANLPGGTAWIVRAYEADNGKLLWKDNFFAKGTFFNDALSVDLSGDKVFVSGATYSDTDRHKHFAVRAYALETGTLLWQDILPSRLKVDFTDVIGAARILTKDKVAIALGSTADEKGRHLAVRAYTKAGKLIWSDTVDSGNGLDIGRSLALFESRIYVAASGGVKCDLTATSNCDALIRTYDLNSGALLWARTDDLFGGNDDANPIVACGNRVVESIATAAAAAAEADWFVRILSGKNGKLLSQDRIRHKLPNFQVVPGGIALANGRLFAAGTIVEGNQGRAIVRAYSYAGESCGAVWNNRGPR